MTVWIRVRSIDVLIQNLFSAHIYTEEEINDELIGKAKMKICRVKIASLRQNPIFDEVILFKLPNK